MREAGFVSREAYFFVIPAKAGIQWEKESGKQAAGCIYAGK
jgi:hypothetical protein